LKTNLKLTIYNQNELSTSSTIGFNRLHHSVDYQAKKEKKFKTVIGLQWFFFVVVDGDGFVAESI
jgi:hypothetical protein